MSDQKHTPEPWRFESNKIDPDYASVTSPPVGDAPFGSEIIPTMWVSTADARRIAACVSFLKNVPIEDLEKWLRWGETLPTMLKRMIEEAEDMVEIGGVEKIFFDDFAAWAELDLDENTRPNAKA